LGLTEPSPAFAGEGWVRVFFFGFATKKKTLILPVSDVEERHVTLFNLLLPRRREKA
jgi:hypothetical protein